MTRFETWPMILSDILRERQTMPFQWGVNDCMLFCSDVVYALTGEDPAAEIRGTYDDEMSAYNVIGYYGDTVEAIIEAKLGESKSVSFAARGDIVTYNCNGRMCGGVVDDTARRAAFIMPEKGLTRIPLKLCLSAWGY